MNPDDRFDPTLDREWEDPNTELEEIQTVQKSLNRRNRRIVLISVVTAAALFALCVFGVIPVLEKLLWNPERNTHNIEFTNDLELAMIAYAELFSPSQTVTDFVPKRTGIGTYELNVQMWDNYGTYDIVYQDAILRRNELEFPTGFWRYTSANIFERASYPVYPGTEFFHANVREHLEPLPDYVTVLAAVSFPEDLTMEELIEFAGNLDGGIGWVGIRNAPADQQCYPLCGMKPWMGGIIFDAVNEYYPAFDVKKLDMTAENLETHFKSLLRFSQDQMDAGYGIDVGYNLYDSYCEGVLNYVEENGVMTYGCYVTCPASKLLEMFSNGTVSQIWPVDAWINVR